MNGQWMYKERRCVSCSEQSENNYVTDCQEVFEGMLIGSMKNNVQGDDEVKKFWRRKINAQITVIAAKMRMRAKYYKMGRKRCGCKNVGNATEVREHYREISTEITVVYQRMGLK